jgi:hypothetical protein
VRRNLIAVFHYVKRLARRFEPEKPQVPRLRRARSVAAQHRADGRLIGIAGDVLMADVVGYDRLGGI